MIGEHIRYRMFWIVDFFRGGSVKYHYDNIRNHLENNGITQNEKQLERLLIHAVKTTVFYKDVDISKGIEGFKVIDKNDIRNNFTNMLSEEYKGKKVFEMATSGSTGTPFIVKQDRDKKNRVRAEIIYFGEKAGYKIGERYIYTRIWTKGNKKSPLELIKQNLIPYDILDLGEENIDKLRNILKKDKNIKYVLGYANTLDILSKHMEKEKDTPNMFNLKIIISGAEKLKKTTKERLKKVVGCDVVSRYSNQENGILAQQCIEEDEFHLNTASYYFEFLKLDKDEPAKIGELARIVITDLYNKAMPIIRYDTGDICELQDSIQCNWKTQVIKDVMGRKVDMIYDTQGNPISGHWSSILWEFDKLKQHQLIQEEEKRYILRVNDKENLYSDKSLKQAIRNMLGNDAIIEIERVDNIPNLASGKYKETICNYVKLNKENKLG